jgi:hypothetical protein
VLLIIASIVPGGHNTWRPGTGRPDAMYARRSSHAAATTYLSLPAEIHVRVSGSNARIQYPPWQQMNARDNHRPNKTGPMYCGSGIEPGGGIGIIFNIRFRNHDGIHATTPILLPHCINCPSRPSESGTDGRDSGAAVRSPPWKGNHPPAGSPRAWPTKRARDSPMKN